MDNNTVTSTTSSTTTQGGGRVDDRRGRGRSYSGRGRGRGGGRGSPPYGSAVQYGGGEDEIRTVFVSGFPADVKEREIHNLFRFFAGYEGCILTENASKQAVAFVSFNSRDLALRALRYLQDVRIDLTSPITLRLSFAKSNSKTKRLSPEDLFPAEHNRFTASLIPPPPSGASLHPSIVNAPYYSPYSQYGTTTGAYAVPWVAREGRNQQGGRNQPRGGQPQYQSGSMPPCSTLFVGNIHPEVPEVDLTRLFKTVPGFQRLKISQKNGSLICFVEYNDIQNSTAALQSFQGLLVGPTPIRIDYARAQMAEKRPLNPQSKDEHQQQSQQQQQQQIQSNIATTETNVAPGGAGVHSAGAHGVPHEDGEVDEEVEGEGDEQDGSQH